MKNVMMYWLHKQINVFIISFKSFFGTRMPQDKLVDNNTKEFKPKYRKYKSKWCNKYAASFNFNPSLFFIIIFVSYFHRLHYLQWYICQSWGFIFFSIFLSTVTFCVVKRFTNFSTKNRILLFSDLFHNFTTY